MSLLSITTIMLCNKLPPYSLILAHELMDQQFRIDSASDPSGLTHKSGSCLSAGCLSHVMLVLPHINLSILSWWEQDMRKQSKLHECFSSPCLCLLAQYYHRGKPRVRVGGHYQAGKGYCYALEVVSLHKLY